MLKDRLHINSRIILTKDKIRKINSVIKLLSEEDLKTIDLPITITRKFKGDFSGLLNSIGVPSYLHHATMIINNISSSDSFLEDIEKIKIIKENNNQKILSYIES